VASNYDTSRDRLEFSPDLQVPLWAKSKTWGKSSLAIRIVPLMSVQIPMKSAVANSANSLRDEKETGMRAVNSAKLRRLRSRPEISSVSSQPEA